MELLAADLDGFVEGTEAERAQRVEEGADFTIRICTATSLVRAGGPYDTMTFRTAAQMMTS